MIPFAAASLALSGCTPGPAVESAEEIGVIEQNEAINGRDGGGSALAFGRSVWTFGDTTLVHADEWDRTWHQNSVSWTEDIDATDGVDGFTEPVDSVGAPRHLIPPTAEEYAFNEEHWDDGDCTEPCGARWAVWPGTPVWDPIRERALVPYSLIYAEPGNLNFTGAGTSIAIWDDIEEPPTRPNLHPGDEHPDLVWDAYEIAPEVAAAIEDDLLYAFACELDGLSRGCVLARAPVADIQTHDKWTWWDGELWQSLASNAVTLFEGAPIMSLSFNTWLNAWLVVYSPPFDGRVFGRTAPQLNGPWSETSLLYVPPGDDSPYDANHHPELDEEEGRTIYVTYSREAGDRWFQTEFPLVEIRFGE